MQTFKALRQKGVEIIQCRQPEWLAWLTAQTNLHPKHLWTTDNKKRQVSQNQYVSTKQQNWPFCKLVVEDTCPQIWSKHNNKPIDSTGSSSKRGKMHHFSSGNSSDITFLSKHNLEDLRGLTCKNRKWFKWEITHVIFYPFVRCTTL